MGNVFERELKGILSGDEEMLGRVTKTCSADERAMYHRIMDRPFLVIRAAGSLGVDLVACRNDLTFPIEVKSSINEVLRFSRSEKLVEQAAQLRRESMRSGLMTLYAFRCKRKRGDSWRLFALELDGAQLDRRLGMIYLRLPKIDHTRKGNLIMRWGEGMPLSEFIEYIHYLSSPSSK